MTSSRRCDTKTMQMPARFRSATRRTSASTSCRVSDDVGSSMITSLAMAADARLVIMDEPTSSLTRHEVDALVRLVADLKRAGICIVFVSHRLDEVMEIAE